MQQLFDSFWINAADIWEKHFLSLVDFVLTVIDSKIETWPLSRLLYQNKFEKIS